MVESILFGGRNGLGESILLKFGNDEYGIIDSFKNPKSKKPKVLEYLKENKIDCSKVSFVLLTHYHQDHFTGISEILLECKKARFFTSHTLAIKSFEFLLAAYQSVDSPHNFFKEFVEIIKILKESNRKILTLKDSSKPIVDKEGVKIYSLSPNKETILYFEEKYKKIAKKITESPNIKLSIGREFNYQSIVVVSRINNISILYGGDQEYHPEDPLIGRENA